SATAVEGHRDGDKTKTIETTACTEPEESYDDSTKIRVPDFQFKYLSSVKSCLQAAGWKVKIKYEDENTYGQGTVMEQFPAADTDVDPKDMPQIQLGVSTGNPS
ncbi:PASTA domain-containing protein, partial [Streptomyces sp. MBT53]|uniref:PASTA domain-containing protein n=1 Tax=Streptomyces sp. MBT53 TaxID=1488384 RepID=UPI001914B0FA